LNHIPGRFTAPGHGPIFPPLNEIRLDEAFKRQFSCSADRPNGPQNRQGEQSGQQGRGIGIKHVKTAPDMASDICRISFRLRPTVLHLQRSTAIAAAHFCDGRRPPENVRINFRVAGDPAKVN